MKTHVSAHYSAVPQPFICILCWARALRRSHLPYRKCAPSLHIPPFIMLTPAQLLLWNGEKWLSQLFPWASCKYVCACIFLCTLVWGVCACDEHWLVWFEHDVRDKNSFLTRWMNFIYLFNGCKTCYLFCWILKTDIQANIYTQRLFGWLAGWLENKWINYNNKKLWSDWLANVCVYIS